MNIKFLLLAFPLAFFCTVGMALASLPCHAEPLQAQNKAQGFYRFTLGKYEVVALSDGTAQRSVDKIMSKPEEVRRILFHNHDAHPVGLSINAFLINTGSKLVLVDTGAGELFGSQSGGELIANLRAAGYQPEQIDAVLLTHIHGDHSGGLSIGGNRVFPNALVYVDKRDPDFWLSSEAEQAAPADRKTTFQQSHATVDPYVIAGKLRSFDGTTQLFEGIRSISIYGHTPGHSAYLIESEGKRLLLWGDIIHVMEVQFQKPEVTIDYDVNPKMAVESRIKLLADAADQRYMVGGAHIQFPGLGYVRADSGGYSWIPLQQSESPTKQH